MTVAQLQELIQQLAGYKSEAESRERDGNMELLLHFLHHSREDKVRKLEALQRELQCLDADLGRVEGTVRGAPNRIASSAEPAELDPAAAPNQRDALESEGRELSPTRSMRQAAMATIQRQRQQQQGRVLRPTAPPAPAMFPEAGMAAAAQYGPDAYNRLAMHPGMATFMSTQHGHPAQMSGGHPQPSMPFAQVLPPAMRPYQDPNASANGGEATASLVHTKRRRIASQFEDLQDAYRRLRAIRASAAPVPTGPSSSEGGGSGASEDAACADQALPSPSGPGSVDEGLQEFSRILSVLTQCNKLKVIAEIPRSALRQASSIISSVEFDRDGALFATAGVSKRISVFDHATVVRSADSVVHCPVVELVTRSKLSCLSWNRYVASHLASSDYEGVVTLWDVGTSSMVQEYEAHAKRIWSVDFCAADPTLLASGSDDCSVKLWSSRTPASLMHIDAKANVCSVRWRPGSAHELGVGSADHSVQLWDLRRPAAPLLTLPGHQKAVSYVRWCNEREMVSASTDSTLRLWNLAPQAVTGPERIYDGHANEKNFVGLAVEGDFLACGSETNEAFVYYKPLSKPVARLAFAGASAGGDDESGALGGTDNDKTFISAVCWRPGGEQLLVANSQGTVRVLQLTGGG